LEEPSWAADIRSSRKTSRLQPAAQRARQPRMQQGCSTATCGGVSAQDSIAAQPQRHWHLAVKEVGKQLGSALSWLTRAASSSTSGDDSSNASGDDSSNTSGDDSSNTSGDYSSSSDALTSQERREPQPLRIPTQPQAAGQLAGACTLSASGGQQRKLPEAFKQQASRTSGQQQQAVHSRCHLGGWQRIAAVHAGHAARFLARQKTREILAAAAGCCHPVVVGFDVVA
jgi:hypothetical protein